MRIYENYYEAGSEVMRDLHEMGVINRVQSMQDIDTTDNDDLAITKEIIGYAFTVLTHDRLDNMLDLFIKVPLETAKSYIAAELEDRVSGKRLNPGNAWQLRADTWEQFMRKHGNEKFSYTYPERMYNRVDAVIRELKEHPGTRQAIIDVYRGDLDIPNWGGTARIPCTMYYQFLLRDEKLNMIYTIRSNDLLEHFCYDLALAGGLQEYVAHQVGKEVGDLIYFIGSLHTYKKDLDTRGIF